jgi:hypothetical protein
LATRRLWRPLARGAGYAAQCFSVVRNAAQRRQSKTVVIVGNSKELPPGRTAEALSRAIDACHTVVRFNEIKNRDCDWIGSRTDILFVRNEGWPAYRRANTALDMPPDLVPSRLVFSMSPEALGIIGDPRPDLADANRSVLFHDQFRAHPELANVPHTFIETPVAVRCYELLRQPGGKPIIPTLGFLAIQSFLQCCANENVHIKIIGFTFEGWSGHDWVLEEKIVGDLCASGRLSIL